MYSARVLSRRVWTNFGNQRDRTTAMAGTEAVAVTFGLVVFASVANIVPAAVLAVGVAVSAAWHGRNPSWK